MKIKGLKDEDFVNFKKPSMFIIAPSCTFKCDIDNNCEVCQNSHLAHAPIIEIDNQTLIERYLNNNITKAIVFGGLEPLDNFKEMFDFIKLLRKEYCCKDEIVIYTGYNKFELTEQLKILKQFPNIIVKFGRYFKDCEPIYDEVLGLELASPNQYAERIS